MEVTPEIWRSSVIPRLSIVRSICSSSLRPFPQATHPGLIELPSALAKRWRGAAKHRPVARRRGKTWCRRGSGDDDAGRNNRRTKHSSVVYCAAPTVSQIESRLHRWVVPTPVWPRRRAERAALFGPLISKTPPAEGSMKRIRCSFLTPSPATCCTRSRMRSAIGCRPPPPSRAPQPRRVVPHARRPRSWSAYPRRTAEVARHRQGQRRKARAGRAVRRGTSLEGHVLRSVEASRSTLREMNRVSRVASTILTATVEAGVTRRQLNKHLRQHGARVLRRSRC